MLTIKIALIVTALHSLLFAESRKWVTASSVANPGTLLVSASLLELDLLVAAQEVEDEVEMVVADLVCFEAS